MGKSYEYKAEGRSFQIQIVRSFLIQNGFIVRAEPIDENPFFTRIFFNEAALEILDEEDWFAKMDLVIS